MLTHENTREILDVSNARENFTFPGVDGLHVYAMASTDDTSSLVASFRGHTELLTISTPDGAAYRAYAKTVTSLEGIARQGAAEALRSFEQYLHEAV